MINEGGGFPTDRDSVTHKIPAGRITTNTEALKRRLKEKNEKERRDMRTLKGRPDGTQGLAAWSPGNPRGNKTPLPKLPFLERSEQRKNKTKE